jgi:hypothetical protein
MTARKWIFHSVVFGFTAEGHRGVSLWRRPRRVGPDLFEWRFGLFQLLVWFSPREAPARIMRTLRETDEIKPSPSH